jgi:hypothetical protein
VSWALLLAQPFLGRPPEIAGFRLAGLNWLPILLVSAKYSLWAQTVVFVGQYIIFGLIGSTGVYLTRTTRALRGYQLLVITGLLIICTYPGTLLAAIALIITGLVGIYVQDLAEHNPPPKSS